MNEVTERHGRSNGQSSTGISGRDKTESPVGDAQSTANLISDADLEPATPTGHHNDPNDTNNGHEGNPSSHYQPPRLPVRVRPPLLSRPGPPPDFPPPPVPARLQLPRPTIQSSARGRRTQQGTLPRTRSSARPTVPLTWLPRDRLTTSTQLPTETKAELSTAAKDPGPSTGTKDELPTEAKAPSLPHNYPATLVTAFQTGPKKPTIIHSNPPNTEQQATIVEEVNMVDSRGSPVYYGAPYGFLGNDPETEGSVSDVLSIHRRESNETRRNRPGGNGRPPQDVVDATAELQRLTHEPSPHLGFTDQQRLARIFGGHRSEDDVDQFADGTPDSVIHHPQVHATGQSIRPSSVIAASTPTRFLTHEFIKSLIHNEMVQHQADPNSEQASRPGVLAALARLTESMSLRTEPGLRMFVRHQVASNAPQISAF
ncbi:hypothetical protein GGR54DRAFT_432808 [Hypoxylon sp. NC1633]|nr:hypothetical protein GGR54DRAFT_432808 [Hypoxylon sp. NC1633]